MKQVQQEANLVNARALIEVRIHDQLTPERRNTNLACLETPGELLRKVCPQARIFPLEQRDDLHDQLHGEVHGRLEHGQLGLYRPVKARVRSLRGANEKTKKKTSFSGYTFTKRKTNCVLGGARNCTILLQYMSGLRRT